MRCTRECVNPCDSANWWQGYKGYVHKEKEVAISRNLLIFSAPAGIELLNLWNDFRKVVKFIDENPWVKPMLEKIMRDKNH